MKKTSMLLAILLAALLTGGCRSPYYADQGALVGALTGMGVGAAIGGHNGNALAGAAIGTAVGTIAGTAVGQSIDADIARSQAEIQARMGRRMAGAVTMTDVVAMSQAGLSDEVISSHIRANGVAQRPQVADLIRLKNQGVSEPVINTFQQTLSPRMSSLPGRRPVVVEEYYYSRPHHYYGPHHGHYYGYSRPPRHTSWGVSFGH